MKIYDMYIYTDELILRHFHVILVLFDFTWNKFNIDSKKSTVLLYYKPQQLSSDWASLLSTGNLYMAWLNPSPVATVGSEIIKLGYKPRYAQFKLSLIWMHLSSNVASLWPKYIRSGLSLLCWQTPCRDEFSSQAYLSTIYRTVPVVACHLQIL